ncbi:cysteine--tRNA ligase [Syntrophus aciditrophicus]|uniref:Cysteine--tRNA ligase n=1 Tax=Syntrophus aciditrophicus (strain SB) TaxID=56780 RepID=Q2LQ77_SYNAS|nr:cysteine--tRNA ligase [Syntrophus aciditrophicus]ABC76162.1 cysteinyl-tRNA synthetase [Syntrophus aciditrophicus SB]
MQKLYGNILEAIGNTPLVEIRRLNPNPNVKIYAKLESFNPGGSIKDRTALYMINEAERRGELTKDKIILEATSGNTGIGLALIAAAKGYRVCFAMAESASDERKKILKALGAELHFTPASLGTDGAIETVYSMMRENPDRYFVPDQFNNPDNILAHYHGTAEEIWQQTGGRVTMAIATMGTTGTVMGIARRLKEYNPEVRIVGVEPYLQHKIQGLKNMKESYRPGIYDKRCLDEKVNILDEDAYEMARRLAREEGILAGMSSGAAMHVAAQKAKEMKEGVIVVIFPDSGERYLSTELFMDKEESTIRFYNVLSRSKNFFRPVNPDKVLMHSCGPTTHEVPHIGSYRRFVVSDLIRRYLEFRGYEVKHVLNIIDLADRSIRGAEREGMDLGVYTARCEEVFLNDINKLNIKKDESYPRASENFDSMVKLVEKLVDKGFAYEKLRSVYFDISKLRDYGCLSNIDLVRVQHGRRIDLDDYEKDSPVDFTLLKRSTLSELKRGVFFKTRWGNVRPSWHLECAAIAQHYLADTFDIHASGSDIVFPHCENVMAIGKAATGKRIANYWINTELVMVGGKKMSRSLNNALTLEDLEKKGYSGREVRFFLVSSHYRKPLNFSFGALDTAKNTVLKLNGFIQRLIRLKAGEGDPDLEQKLYDLRQGFTAAMDDDLNISGALAVLFDFVKKVSSSLAQGVLTVEQRDQVLEALKKIDDVLGVMKFEEEQISEEALQLMKRREALRQEGRWAQADEIRQRLLDMGVVVADTPEGMVWRLK